MYNLNLMYSFQRAFFDMPLKIGLQERQRFVQTYLSFSGSNLVAFICFLYVVVLDIFSLSSFMDI